MFIEVQAPLSLRRWPTKDRKKNEEREIDARDILYTSKI